MGVKKKIVLLGDSAVGKTSLVKRYVNDIFEDAYVSSVGSKVTKKEFRITRPDKTVDLTFLIWDLIGREGYKGFHAWSFAGVYGALLVADVTRKETLASLERYWIPSLYQVAQDVPLVFVANKTDLDGRTFELDAVATLASKYNIGLEHVLPAGLTMTYATSAKTGDNVQEAFEALGHLVLAGKPPTDPVKSLFESAVAMVIAKGADTSTLIGALDAIMVDFWQKSQDEFDEVVARMILRQEIARAGLDVRNPSRDGILKVVDYLAEVEADFHDSETVARNRARRVRWGLGAGE